MDANKDLYEVLGVERDADQKKIKRAYLKLAQKYHPDVSKEDNAEEKFKEINEAYSVLGDEEKRANYDRFGTADAPFGGFSDFGGFGDIFSDIFGGGMGGSTRRARSQRTRGRHVGMRLRITLEEAASGCTKNLKYTRLGHCESCMGTGVSEGGSVVDCPTCHGSGVVTSVQQTILGTMQSQTTCPDCNGTGKTVDNPCPECHGEGRVTVTEEVKVDIPAGIHSGQQISVHGKGEAGVRGADAGDLLVTIDIEQSDDFERQGDDLYCIRTINCFDAMLGCTLHIPGILADEVVDVEVPAGTQFGDRLEVEGYGMPRMRTNTRGKLVVLIEVTIPTDLAKDEIACLEEMSKIRATGDEEPKKKKAKPRRKPRKKKGRK